MDRPRSGGGCSGSGGNASGFEDFDLTAGAGLEINGQEIVAPGAGVASADALVSAVNSASGLTGVLAHLGLEGEIILRNSAGQKERVSPSEVKFSCR